jgi:hypothetical protein
MFFQHNIFFQSQTPRFFLTEPGIVLLWTAILHYCYFSPEKQTIKSAAVAGGEGKRARQQCRFFKHRIVNFFSQIHQPLQRGFFSSLHIS